MMSWKALRLCFVLLLHSTNFGQSRVLEKDSPSVKKAQQAQAVYRYEATVNGEDLRRRIMQISEDPRAQRYQGNKYGNYKINKTLNRWFASIPRGFIRQRKFCHVG